MSGNLKKEFGDYQTPEDFALVVCEYLKNKINIEPCTIVEPTCGIGGFISSSLKTWPYARNIYGIEINLEYVEECKKHNNDERVKILHDNFFTFNTPKLTGNDNVLVVGNPPWATNSELNFNLPEKINFRNLSGMDALTGGSNFDICEYMILKLIEEYKNTDTTIAMLCKTSVARNVFLELNRNETSTELVQILEFNANKIFGISASACLLVIKLSTSAKNFKMCEVLDINSPEIINDVIVCENMALKSKNNNIVDLEGECELEWRQGVKHDVSKIMELTKKDTGVYVNGKKDEIELEETIVFPLLKSSHFKNPVICDNFKKYVIVTQKKARESTEYIRHELPKTYKYLDNNRELFDSRKSSIYKGAPDFSMFGVGPYSYAPYKVGLSGFYKNPLFCLVYNSKDEEHPVMGDDTSYFLDFYDKSIAYTCMILLNSKKVQDFLISISFQDAKRPYTKKVLARISLIKAIDNTTIKELQETEKKIGLDSLIDDNMLLNLKKYIENGPISS